jgi:hypothetical protein
VRTQQESQRLVDRLAGSAEGRRAVANGGALLAIAGLGLALAIVADDGWGAFATALLALAFAWAAVSKLADLRGWRRTLEAHGLPVGVERAAIVAVPLAEAVVPILAAAGWTRAAGAWALTLLIAFTVEALRAWRRFGPQVPCGCFGGREPVAPGALLVRNAALGAVALVVALRPPPPPVFAWPGWPGPDEIVPAVLVIAGLAVAGFTAWNGIRWLGPRSPA